MNLHTMTEIPAAEKQLAWPEANRLYLETALAGLRLRLERRIAWLRQQWQADPLHGHPQVITDRQVDWRLREDEDRQAELAFYETLAATAHLQEITVQLETLAERMAAAGSPPALPGLGNLFQLSLFEQNILLLCLAPESADHFPALFAYIQDDVSRPYPTLHLAHQLFPEYESGLNVLTPEAPLRRFNLVEIGEHMATAAAPLSLSLRLSDYLRGQNYLDPWLEPFLQSIPAAPLPPGHRQLAGQVWHWLNRQQGPPVINLLGAAGSGKRALAQAVCDHVGLQLVHLDLSLLAAAGMEQLLRVLPREAVLLHLAFYLDGTAVEKEQRPLVSRFISRLAALSFLGAEERWPLEQPGLVLRVPRPTAAEQRQMWQAVLADTAADADTGAPDPDLDRLTQQFDFGPHAIAAAAAEAANRAGLAAHENGTAVNQADLWHICREQAAPELGQLAIRIQPVFTWDDIVLPDRLLAQLHEVAAQVANRYQVYEGWGFGKLLSRGRGISALFAGPSGTGKTMAAEILARALQLDLFLIDLASVVSKYIGETEKNLKQLFDAAEQSGAILFFDEADALFGKRTEVKDSHDRYANIEINYLLQRMEAYRGLAILATNRKSDLDQAFMRRLRYLLEFPFPDHDGRARIWQKVFPPQAPQAELDYQVLARLEISGGNIRNIALNAAFLAAAAGTPITMEHVMAAARREYAKIGKMMRPAEFGPYLSPPKG